MQEGQIIVSKLPGKLGEKANSLRRSGESIETELNTSVGTGILITGSRIIFVFAGIITINLKSACYSFSELKEVKFIVRKGKLTWQLEIKFIDELLPMLTIDIDMHDSNKNKIKDILMRLKKKPSLISIIMEIDNIIQNIELRDQNITGDKTAIPLEIIQSTEDIAALSNLPGKLGLEANRLKFPGESIEGEVNFTIGSGMLLTEGRIIFVFAGWSTNHQNSAGYQYSNLKEIELIRRQGDPVLHLCVKFVDVLFSELHLTVSNDKEWPTRDLLKKLKNKSNSTNVIVDTALKPTPVQKTTSASTTVLEFTVVGGYGHSLQNGITETMEIVEETLYITDSSIDNFIQIHVDEVVDITIGGPGEVVSGGGFVGGGFGLSGMMKGVITASVLNALTTSRNITTIVQITTRTSEYIFVSNQIVPSEMSMALSPILGRLRSRQKSIPLQTPNPPDLVSRLTNLANLRQSGALTDEEFRSAKAQLLS